VGSPAPVEGTPRAGSPAAGTRPSRDNLQWTRIHVRGDEALIDRGNREHGN
jgi:hypothetical protein